MITSCSQRVSEASAQIWVLLWIGQRPPVQAVSILPCCYQKTRLTLRISVCPAKRPTLASRGGQRTLNGQEEQLSRGREEGIVITAILFLKEL